MGGCGQITCEPFNDDYHDNCSKAVEHEYKFYLSLENSLCKEYVTEKLYARMEHNVVPIVLGRGQYNNGVTPPHSVIDISDFDTPQELAKYLLWLNKHPEEYLSYFWWKDYYDVEFNSLQHGACEVCRKLHSETETPTVIDDLYQWWVEDAACSSWSVHPDWLTGSGGHW